MFLFCRMPIMNTLYLGMATDILAPLLLVPDVDVIYVMNVLDKAFGGTWEEHKQHICTVLEQGNDTTKILLNIDNTKQSLDAKWILEFIYNGKPRKLIYYYDFNFVYHVWPEEIRNIHHILWNGTYTWDMLMTDYDHDGDYCPSIKTIMAERMTSDAYLYALSFNHTWFPEHISLNDGSRNYSVAKLKLDFTNSDWWKKEL